ncbi:MAG: DUF2769 domain-containing protein [Candidatus Paceibacterota bacterium]
MKPKNNPENFDKCFCPNCPLYADCNKNKAERVFCARTVSECEMDSKKMCICPTCPVYAENKLVGAYFCLIELK